MFPAKRIERLIGRDKKDKNSITNNMGASHVGVPCGKNNDKKCIPCLMKPVKVTKRKITAATANVTII